VEPNIEKGLVELKKNSLVNFTFPKDAVEALDNLAKGAKKSDRGSIINNKVKDKGIGYRFRYRECE